jgi:hypothetical protein
VGKRKFRIEAWEADHWVRSQKILYASASEGADGQVVRLYYHVGYQQWEVSRGLGEPVLVTKHSQEAVDLFNDLI